MSLALQIVCASCLKQVPANGEPGTVLSCGDFLCARCARAMRHGTCPACGKQGIRSASLDHNLPEEVRQNISDPTQEAATLQNILVFQVRYYRQTISRLVSKVEELEERANSLER